MYPLLLPPRFVTAITETQVRRLNNHRHHDAAMPSGRASLAVRWLSRPRAPGPEERMGPASYWRRSRR